MKLTAIISLLALTLLGSTATALAQQEKPAPALEQEQKRPPRPSPRPTPAGEPAFGQEKQKCPCDIIGTWKAQISNTEARLYEFDADGVVKVLKVSGDTKPLEIATAKYKFIEEPLVEEPAAPTQKPPDIQVSFTATGKNRIFGKT